MTGSMNWAITLTFDNDDTGTSNRLDLPLATAPGVSRRHCRRTHCQRSGHHAVRSSQRTSVPLPAVFAFSPRSDNDIGVPYILQSKATGTLLLNYSIREATGKGPGLTDVEQCAVVMRQLSEYTEELSRVCFGQIGSLVYDKGDNDDDKLGNSGTASYSVGPCLAPAFIRNHRHLLDKLDRGPFPSQAAYFAALTSALSRHAQELPMATTHCSHPFRSKPTTRMTGLSKRLWAGGMTLWLSNKIDHSRNRFAYCMGRPCLA